MKFILCLIGVVILLPTAGCIGPDHRGDREYRGREENRGQEENRERSQYRSYPKPGVDVTTERLEVSYRVA